MKRSLPYAFCLAVLTIVATYAVIRVAQLLFFPAEPNPALVIATARIAMFWRLAMGAYLAVPVFVITLFVPERFARAATQRALVPVALAIAVQGVFFP